MRFSIVALPVVAGLAAAQNSIPPVIASFLSSAGGAATYLPAPPMSSANAAVSSVLASASSRASSAAGAPSSAVASASSRASSAASAASSAASRASSAAMITTSRASTAVMVPTGSMNATRSASPTSSRPAQFTGAADSNVAGGLTGVVMGMIGVAALF